MSSVEAGLRDLIRALVREELAALHGDAAPRELVQARLPGSTSPDGQPPLDKAIYTAEEVARLLGCSPKAVYAKSSRGSFRARSAWVARCGFAGARCYRSFSKGVRRRRGGLGDEREGQAVQQAR